MNATKTHRVAWFGMGALWALVIGMPVMADDTELFGGIPPGGAGQPNILFIIDDSRSMDGLVTTRVEFDPNVGYGGSCLTSAVYFKTDTGGIDPPTCGSNQYFNATALKCAAAKAAFQGPGFFFDVVAQFDEDTDFTWEALNAAEKDWLVECKSDSPFVNPPGHGDGVDPAKLYAQNGTQSEPWSASAGNEIDWALQQGFVLYSGNFLNWYYNGPTEDVERLTIVKRVTKDLLDAVNGVNVGMMSFNNNTGGRVGFPVEDIATARTPLKAAIDLLDHDQSTPLSEALYEAQQYFRGADVYFGDMSPYPSVPGSRLSSAAGDPDYGYYDSPINLECQKNFVIFLTDGVPTSDTDIDDSDLDLLPDYNTHVPRTCGTIDWTGVDTSGGPSPNGGECLDEIAEYMFKADMSPENGVQNVVTNMIGFLTDFPLLEDTAAAGGGEYQTADDTISLLSVLTEFVLKMLNTDTTFTAPAVSINSFNRTQHLNDLFISVFSPSDSIHWPGNLKKYRLRAADGAIVDSRGDPATTGGPGGFFAAGTRSYWSAVDDGPNVEQGGAANLIPDPTQRVVYTHLPGDTGGAPVDLTSGIAHRVAKTNAAITNAVLNIGGGPTRDEVIDFINNGDPSDLTLPRYQMGDPLHAQPVTVIYDGSDPNAALVFFATNDGYLHAINPNTGVEEWAFLPVEFLGDQGALYQDNTIGTKHYGIDGHLTVQIKANNDSVIDPATEKVYLTMGMRRGGNFYYSLDVTNPQVPKLMWRRGSGELTGNGQSWSRPVPAKMNVNVIPAQNADKLVLVLGGGYDATQDSYNNIVDTNGNSIYIIDSVSGDVLWRGTKSGGDKDFANMNSSFPGDVKVIDLDIDGFADRMYAADTGGQVWRFDIFNGEDPADLITGGVFAQLGAAPLPDSPPALVANGPDNRRFYYSPDVALVTTDDANFLHIGIGSGYRAHPKSTVNSDRFYALRDYQPFVKLDDMGYATMEASPIQEGDLEPITADTSAVIPQNSPGWMLELTVSGEKVLAEARTFNNQVFFTSFIPSAISNPADPCAPGLATNRLYVVDLLNGSPVANLDGDATEDEPEDRYREFSGTITSEVVFIFPSPDDPNSCVGDECTPPPVACVDLFCFPTNFANSPVRTFWSEESIDLE